MYVSDVRLCHNEYTYTKYTVCSLAISISNTLAVANQSQQKCMFLSIKKGLYMESEAVKGHKHINMNIFD